jgi:hypothetical protein
MISTSPLAVKVQPPAGKPCRICKGTRLVPFLSLGEQPHCNSFLRADQLAQPEPRWPLDLLFCEDCHLVQLGHVVDPDLMFRDYVYVSGTTRTLTEHFRRSAEALVARYQVPAGSLVADIGSNDGTFLQQFKDLGLAAVGIDPATNIAALASSHGIETVNEYFGQAVAREIRGRLGSARLMTAAGVFFHIDDMDDVCRGVAELLAPDGVFQIQAIYLGSMLEQTAFDSVYHEHVSYYTLGPLVRLLDRFDLTVFEVDHSPIHNGSLLVDVCHRGQRPVGDSVRRQLALESARGWDTLAPYQAFARRVEAVRDRLLEMLNEFKAGGWKLAALGAPAKGNTLLNYCGIGPQLLDYAAEKAPLKIGLHTPGTHLPVISEPEALARPPACFLLLPWNFRDELISRYRPYLDQGGRLIVPLPEPELV